MGEHESNAAPAALPRLSSTAYAADLLALCRAALEGVNRVLRCAPEVRESRLMARWPVDLEELLLEIEPTATETPFPQLVQRLGCGTSQVKSAVARLQRMNLVDITETGVSLTPHGRQKLARLETARASVLRRLADRLEVELDPAEAVRVLSLLSSLVERTDELSETGLPRT